MYYGRKCSVLACTGNAEIVHGFLKEPNTQRAVMFVYEKITVQFNPQLHISLNQFTEDSFENLGQCKAGFAMKLLLKRAYVHHSHKL